MKFSELSINDVFLDSKKHPYIKYSDTSGVVVNGGEVYRKVVKIPANDEVELILKGYYTNI